MNCILIFSLTVLLAMEAGGSLPGRSPVYDLDLPSLCQLRKELDVNYPGQHKEQCRVYWDHIESKIGDKIGGHMHIDQIMLKTLNWRILHEQSLENNTLAKFNAVCIYILMGASEKGIQDQVAELESMKRQLAEQEAGR